MMAAAATDSVSPVSSGSARSSLRHMWLPPILWRYINDIVPSDDDFFMLGLVFFDLFVRILQHEVHVGDVVAVEHALVLDAAAQFDDDAVVEAGVQEF